ncbi:MAG TPA: hypothetical protein VGE84_03950, partial [Allosphingosinicella sp.]
MVATPVAAERQVVGIFSQWGAFQEKGRCFAIARPDSGAGGNEAQAFASVGYWAERKAGAQVHFRLGRDMRTGAAILLRIDEDTYQLIGAGANAWAPDARADAAIVAAMRRGIGMTIESRSGEGRLIREAYRLRGAATAIDAAAVA